MVEDIKLRVEQFEKFYYFLMKNAPKGYTPWFFPCEKLGKNPCPIAILNIDKGSKGSWHHESARLTKEQCIDHIKKGYNIGISARENDKLIIGDIDNKEFLNQVPKETLTTISRKRVGLHFFGWDKDGTAKINVPTDNGEMRSRNQYVLAPGSFVPFDLLKDKDKKVFEELPREAREDIHIGYYTVGEAIEPRELSLEDIPTFFKEKDRENIMVEDQQKRIGEIKNSVKKGKYSDLFNLKVSDIIGSIPPNKRTGHPLHDSDTDANFSLSSEGSIGHCWRHMVSLNAVQFLCVQCGYAKCEDAGTGHKGRSVSRIKGDKKALESAYKEAVSKGLIKEYVKPDKEKEVGGIKIFTRRGQIETFWNTHPFYYDNSKMFWLWNKDEFKWELSDEVDFLNSIQELLGLETIESKIKSELVEGFKQIGRRHKPKELEKTWVQFKDKIYDIKNGKILNASPEYFVTNPIPWKIGKSEDTPTIDKYFNEWVEPEYVPTLYQILAYNTTQNKFMQRIIALCGGGSNGKGTFIKLNYKFIGEKNCVASEVKQLSEDKFEPAVLYRKLLCVMGEVSYDDLRNTNTLKKLGGEDKISFQFKGKTPFTDDNTATCICLTNSMPITPDKSMGFYRKWLIIDFPNQFKQIYENLINKIPDTEFENLAKKSLRILKEMYEKPTFTMEGDFEERARRYEERSNPVMRFIEDYCEEAPGENITIRELTNKCNEYLKAKHLRIMSAIQVGKVLRNEGFSVGQRKIDDISSVVVLNLSFKNHSNHPNHQNVCRVPYRETSTNIDGSNGSNGFPSKIEDFTEDEILQSGWTKEKLREMLD